MMRAFKTLGLLAALVSFTGCVRESSPEIARELHQLDTLAREGVAKIERALSDPGLTSTELGDGVSRIEVAARGYAAIETDARASDLQQLTAIVHQARAWDDVALTFAAAPAPPSLDSAQRSVLTRILDEKALPARMSAATSYARALDLACKTALDQHPLVAEIVDGLARYGSDHVSLDRPCAEQ